MSRTYGVSPSPARRSKRLVQSGYYTPNEDEDLTTNLLTFDDTESVGVTSEVGDSTKDVNGKEVNSPYLALVNVRPSFEYTVE